MSDYKEYTPVAEQSKIQLKRIDIGPNDILLSSKFENGWDGKDFTNYIKAAIESVQAEGKTVHFISEAVVVPPAALTATGFGLKELNHAKLKIGHLCVVTSNRFVGLMAEIASKLGLGDKVKTFKTHEECLEFIKQSIQES